jgi:hypothetical protein
MLAIDRPGLGASEPDPAKTLRSTLAARRPNATRAAADPEAGGPALWTRAHDIFAALRARVAPAGKAGHRRA